MGRSLRQKDRANVFCAGKVSCAGSYAEFFAGRAFGKEVLPAFLFGMIRGGFHMVDIVTRVNNVVNGFVWGPFGLALLFCTGLWLSVRTGF